MGSLYPGPGSEGSPTSPMSVQPVSMAGLQAEPPRATAKNFDEPGAPGTGARPSPLMRRIATLTRLLDARDRTIDLLISRLDVDAQREFRTRGLLVADRGDDDACSCGTADASLLQRQRLVRSQQAQKMESIGQLAVGIAHELNTPVQYVADNMLFLRRAFDALNVRSTCAPSVPRDAQARPDHVDGTMAPARLAALRNDIVDALDQSAEGLQRIVTIVGAMKKFSCPSNGRPSAVDLVDVVETTLAIASSETRHVADVTTDFDPDLGEVTCLRDELAQVVLNLVVNAAHAIAAYKPGTRGRIAIATRREGAWAEISVSDDGGGIDAAIRERVFEPFFTTKPVGVGSGQGLAIARDIIVGQHHGELWFDSCRGDGTTFHVRVPIVPPLLPA